MVTTPRRSLVPWARGALGSGLRRRLDVWGPCFHLWVEMRVDVTPEVCCGGQRGDACKERMTVRPGTKCVLSRREGLRLGKPGAGGGRER